MAWQSARPFEQGDHQVRLLTRHRDAARRPVCGRNTRWSIMDADCRQVEASPELQHQESQYQKSRSGCSRRPRISQSAKTNFRSRLSAMSLPLQPTSGRHHVRLHRCETHRNNIIVNRSPKGRAALDYGQGARDTSLYYSLDFRGPYG